MRYVPEHPEKGTPEAYVWAEKMRAARQKKARTKYAVRQAGLKTEAEFFGPGGPLEVKALQKHRLNPSPKYSVVCQGNGCTFLREKLTKRQANQEASSHQSMTGHDVAMVMKNPGEKWHEGMQKVAERYRKEAQSQTEKHIYAGMEIAHKDSASAARKLGMNPSGLVGGMIHDGWDLTVGTRKQPKVFSRLLNGFEHHIQHESKGWRLLEANKRMGQREMVSVGVYHHLADGVRVADERAYVKNPIAIYNPPVEPAGTIYNNAIEIRAQKTGGPLKGHYRHVFGKNVQIIGLTNGTVLLKHKHGKPLWITRKDYERSGRKH